MIITSVNAQTGEVVTRALTTEETAGRTAAEQAAPEVLLRNVKQSRAAAYAAEADPLFFQAQRGEATMDEWTAKVAEIRTRYPYPGDAE